MCVNLQSLCLKQRNSESTTFGSITDRSMVVHASNNENSDSQNDDYRLRASKKYLGHPAKPLYQNALDLDATMVSN